MDVKDADQKPESSATRASDKAANQNLTVALVLGGLIAAVALAGILLVG